MHSSLVAAFLFAEVAVVAPASKPIVVVVEGAGDAAAIRSAISAELGVKVLTLAESASVQGAVQGTLLVSVGATTATLVFRDERGQVVTRTIELPSATLEVSIALLAGNLVRDQTTPMIPAPKPPLPALPPAPPALPSAPPAAPATPPIFVAPAPPDDVPQRRPFFDDRYALSMLVGTSSGMNRGWADTSGLAIDVQAVRRTGFWSAGLLTGVVTGSLRGESNGTFAAMPLAGTLEARWNLGSLALEGGAAFGTVIFDYSAPSTRARDSGFAPYLRLMGSFALPLYDHFDFVGRLGWATTFRKVSPADSTSPLDAASWTFLAGVRAHL